MALTLLGCGEEGAPPASATFDEFAWPRRAADVRVERLCEEAADPDHAADTTFIHCRIEGDTFANRVPPAPDQLTVVAYNIERGFQSAAQIDLLRQRIVAPAVPDVLLLSEVDRGCRRTQFRNLAREYAEAFGYYYVYATEFVELPGNRGFSGPYDPPLCEHGNAIVARYPLGNVRQIRHAQNRKRWYTPPGHPNPDEPRLGGRVAIAADMRVGDRLVRLYSLHLESSVDSLRLRDAQAVEIATEAAGLAQATIAGGDLNAYFARFDLTSGTQQDGPTQAFLRRGLSDAHAGLPLDDRATAFDAGPLIIDFLFTRQLQVVGAGVCPQETCGALSDHLPVWTVLRWLPS